MDASVEDIELLLAHFNVCKKAAQYALFAKTSKPTLVAHSVIDTFLNTIITNERNTVVNKKRSLD